MSRKALALIYSSHHKSLCDENSELFSDMHLVCLSSRINSEEFKASDFSYDIFGSELQNLKKGIVPYKYYKKLRQLIKSENPSTIILFTLDKPVSRYVIDTFQTLKIELWEDGVGHYLDSKVSKRTKIFNLIKRAASYYPNEINSTNYGIEKVLVRNRFIKDNLIHKRILPKKGKKIIIGQPVVEDGFVKKRDYIEIVNCLISQGFIYLAHPREKRGNFKDGEVSLGINSAEEYIKNNGCSALVSVFSTVNFNIDIEKNFWLSSILKLDDISDSLHDIAKKAKVKIPSNLEELLREL